MPTSYKYLLVWKREVHKHWSKVKPEKVAPVTGTTSRVTGPVLVDSRQGTPSVRNCVTRLTRDRPDGGRRSENGRRRGKREESRE